MAYNSNKGNQHSGDIQYEQDPTDTQIDFENDSIALKTGGQQRLVTNNTHISSSLNISGAAFYAAGNLLGGNTGVSADSYTYTALTVDAQGRITAASSGTPPAIATLSNAGSNRVITSDGGNQASGESNLTFNGSKLSAVGHISASLGVSGSSLHTLATTVDSIHVSSSLNVSGAAFYANGVLLTGGGGAITTYNNAADNRVITSVDSSTVQGEANLTFNGTVLSVPTLTSSVGVHVSGSNAKLAIGFKSDPGTQSGMLAIRPIDTSNRVLALMQATEQDGGRIALGVSGSGAITVGGGHFGGILNISGSDEERLISVKTDSSNPLFFLDATGDVKTSGSLTLKDTEPSIHFSSSADATARALIGLNSSNNILVQNSTTNKHIVFKANDNGTIREGFRIDGAIPEVVVNQGGDSLIDFRVESDNNANMLFVDGAADKVGINSSAPNRTLSVSGTTSVNNAVGVALQVTGAFEATERVRGKMFYYTHHHFAGASNNSWFPFVTNIETTNADERHAMVVPHDGRLVKILFRVENAQNAVHTLRLYKGVDGVKELDTAGAVEVEAIQATLPNTDSTTVTFATSGTVHYNAGDIVGIKMGTFAVNTADVEATCVWEYNQLIP